MWECWYANEFNGTEAFKDEYFINIIQGPSLYERIVLQKNPAGLEADAAETTQPCWKHAMHLEIIIINLKPTSYHQIVSDSGTLRDA